MTIFAVPAGVNVFESCGQANHQRSIRNDHSKRRSSFDNQSHIHAKSVSYTHLDVYKRQVVIAVKMPPSGSKLYVDLPTEKNAAGEFVFSDYPYWEKSE